MEDYFERVVDTLTGAGYRWYETANFCRVDEGRDLRARHNLAYWLGRDYLGIGIGAVSTVAGLRWRNAPSLPRYLAALRRGERPARELEPLDADVQARERLLLGLRLDEPLATTGLDGAVDADALARLVRGGLVDQRPTRSADPPRPLPRRRRHRRAALVESPANDRDQRAQAGPPHPRRRGVCRNRRAGRLEDARRACGPGRLGLDGAQRARRAGGARPAHAPAHVGRGIPTEEGYRFYAGEVLARQEPRPARFPLDLISMRSEIESALQSTTEMLSQVTRLLALVSAPGLETATVRHVEVLLLAAVGRHGRDDHVHGRRRQEARHLRRLASIPASPPGRTSI